MHQLVVHCKRSKYDVYIGRPSKFGNPFTIGKDGSRDEVIAKYKTWLKDEVAVGRFTIDDFAELKGKVLACWCAPLPCHGEVIVEVIEKLIACGKL